MGRTGQQMRQRTTKAMAPGGQGGNARTLAVRATGRGDRLHYWFDNSMSRGMSALVAWLALSTLVLIVVIATGIEAKLSDRRRGRFVVIDPHGNRQPRCS